MKSLYRQAEAGFERIASVATSILSNPITFILALGLVAFWLTHSLLFTEGINQSVHDVIIGISFLSLFILQKSFIRFSASLHLKLNELVASHEPASNAVINAEKKTEQQIADLSKRNDELAEQVLEVTKEG